MTVSELWEASTKDELIIPSDVRCLIADWRAMRGLLWTLRNNMQVTDVIQETVRALTDGLKLKP